MAPSDSVKIAENATKLEGLAEDIREFKAATVVFRQDMWKAIDELRNDLVKRPSWAVTMWLTACTSLTLSMLVFVLTHLLKGD